MLLELVINFTQPMDEQDKIGAKGAIHEKLTTPMAIRMLLAEEILLSSRDSVSNLLVTGHPSGVRNRSGQSY